MEWLRLSKAEAKQITGNWNSMSFERFTEFEQELPAYIENNLNEEYKALRRDILSIFKKISSEVSENPQFSKRVDYCFDYKFGLELFQLLNIYGFSQRLASMDEVWIYLCLKVVPEVIIFRYPGKKTKSESGDSISLNVNEERFWKNSRRIYLKVIWWYVYLSMQDGVSEQETIRKTEEVLKNNNTDTIVQLVERAGKAGYRVDLYRSIIKYYADFNAENKAEVLRRVMVLNTARTMGIEPQLCAGGVTGYVKELFDYFK